MPFASPIITAVGTPVMTRATTGSITGTWGTGQNRTAGNLLVAVITAGGTTASSAGISCSTYPWEQLGSSVANDPAGGASFAWTAIFVSSAQGADSAPAFTATLSGTVAMTCTLLELQAAEGLVPQDLIAYYSSGTSAAALTGMTVAAPAGRVTSVPGEYAFTVYCQEAAAATNTWNPGTGWTNLANDGATSSVLHTAIDYQANVANAVVLTETAHWTTNASAYGAATLVAISPQQAGVEVFGDNASTTISSGGTTAPVAGTPEIWTAASWSSFPVAQQKYTLKFDTAPAQYFKVSDPAVPSEIIAVLNTSTGLVIRGADGTTPVAHAAGFTVKNVISSGWLNRCPPNRVIVPPPTGTQATDSANIRAALREAAAYGAMNNGNLFVGGTAVLQNGSYQLDTNQLVIPDGVVLELSAGTILVSNCTGGASVDAITLGAASMIIGEGGHNSGAYIMGGASINARTLISNAYHAIQEYAYIAGVNITCGGGTLAVAVVEFNGVFVDSGIRDTTIYCANANTAGTAGLLITGSPTSGFGPVFAKNLWIYDINGPCMKITENNPTKGACAFWGEDLDLEHPSSGYCNLQIDGFGGIGQVIINRLHTESDIASATQAAAVKINGVKSTRIEGFTCLAGSTANKYAVWITNSGQNGSVIIDNLQNNNGLTPTLQDDIAGISVGTSGQDLPHYDGPAQKSLRWGSVVLAQGDLELGSQSVALASTSVNAMNGNIVDVAALAAAVTVAAPTNPVNNQMLIYKFVQNGTGGFAVTWNAIFRVAAGVVSTTASKASVVAFRYDSSLTAWVQLWATTGV